MGKSFKKKSGSAKGKQPNTRAPFAPYVSDDGIRYSGLETEGMKTLSCSLLFPESRNVRPDFNRLKPQAVTLYRDSLYDLENEHVEFPGATVLQLEVIGTAGNPSMPEIGTVAGKCRFTAGCYKEFAIMMRTREEAKRARIPVNGALDW